MIEAVNRWIQDYCRAEKFVYVDYYSAVADAAGRFKGELSDDGINPNARGYRVISPVTLDALSRALPRALDPETQTRPRGRIRPSAK